MKLALFAIIFRKFTQRVNFIYIYITENLKELQSVGLHMQTSLQNPPYSCGQHHQLLTGFVNGLPRTLYESFLVPHSCHCLLASSVSLPKQPTNSIEQSPSWEANNHSPNKDIPYLLWNPNIHYHVHKNPPPISILSQMNPVYIFQSYFPNIHSDTILSFVPRSSVFPPGFHTKILYAFLICPMCATCLTHIILDLITLVTFGEAYTS